MLRRGLRIAAALLVAVGGATWAQERAGVPDPAALGSETGAGTGSPATPTTPATPTSTPTPTTPATPTPNPTPTGPAPSPMALRRAGQGDALSRAGDWRGALFAYQEAANLDPRSAEVRLKLGGAYEKMGYLDEAARQYELAAALEPPGAEALRRAERARAAARGQVPPEPAAAPAPARAAGGADNPAAASYEVGVAAIGQGRFAEALAALDEAVRADPKLAVAYTARASALFGLGRYVEAAGDYRTALALEPAQATPLFGLGECYRMLGQGTTAADYYDRYASSSAADARGDLKAEARKRAAELAPAGRQ